MVPTIQQKQNCADNEKIYYRVWDYSGGRKEGCVDGAQGMCKRETFSPYSAQHCNDGPWHCACQNP